MEQYKFKNKQINEGINSVFIQSSKPYVSTSFLIFSL